MDTGQQLSDGMRGCRALSDQEVANVTEKGFPYAVDAIWAIFSTILPINRETATSLAKIVRQYAGPQRLDARATRNLCFFLTGVHTGYRVSELCNLQVRHVFNPVTQSIKDHIRQEAKNMKGKTRSRMCILHPAAKQVLLQHLQMNFPSLLMSQPQVLVMDADLLVDSELKLLPGLTSTHLRQAISVPKDRSPFLPPPPQPVHPSKIQQKLSNARFAAMQKELLFPFTPRHANRLLLDAFNRCGVPGPGISCHCLRKTFALRFFLASGRDLRATQSAMGHARVDSTASYVPVSQDGINSIILAMK